MARIANIDLPKEKRVKISLTRSGPFAEFQPKRFHRLLQPGNARFQVVRVRLRRGGNRQREREDQHKKDESLHI